MSGGTNTSPSPHMSRVYGKRAGRPKKLPDAVPAEAAVQGPLDPPPIKMPYLRFLDRSTFYSWERGK
jgi:hypothetical protein